ncbi:MAG: anti-phage protein KwaA [Phascolarctobacterium sp.]|nr:anti-phage protein KwaA [Phascolarctobacterium sp.]
MIADKKMKIGLIVQSFAPLFLILFVKNYDNTFLELLCGLFQNHKSAIESSLLVKLLPNFLFSFICFLVLSYGFISYRSFNDSQNRDYKSHGELIANVQNCNDVSINFFVTYIMPLSSDKVETFRDMLVFTLIIGIIFLLMYKTNLYYQNPILVILGYEIFKFTFDCTDNSRLQGKEFIGVSKENLTNGTVIKWKYISDGVFIVFKENISDTVRAAAKE